MEMKKACGKVTCGLCVLMLPDREEAGVFRLYPASGLACTWHGEEELLYSLEVFRLLHFECIPGLEAAA